MKSFNSENTNTALTTAQAARILPVRPCCCGEELSVPHVRTRGHKDSLQQCCWYGKVSMSCSSKKEALLFSSCTSS